MTKGNSSSLQFSQKRNTDFVGAQALRNHVLDITWRKYNDSIPDLLKQIRTLKKERMDSLKVIQQQINTLDNKKLRSLTSNYLSEFLLNLVNLLQGTLEGNPAINGQSLKEELHQAGLHSL